MPERPAPPSWPDVCALLALWHRAQLPGPPLVEVTLGLADGRQLALPFIPAAEAPRRPDAPPTKIQPAAAEDLHQGGLYFSPIEAAIVNALGRDQEAWLLGKQIAKMVSQPYGGHFRSILQNLIQRKILERRQGGQGYRLHPGFRPGGGQAGKSR